MYYPPTSDFQCSNFSSMIKDKKYSWISINIPDKGYFYKSQLIGQISKVACFPYCTIVEIYKYNRIYIEESINYIKLDNLVYLYKGVKKGNLNNLGYSYNCEKNTIYYAYVNLNNDSVFNNINNNQLQSERNKKYLEKQVNDLNRTISYLNDINWESNWKINDLTAQNKELKKKQEKINKEMKAKKQ